MMTDADQKAATEVILGVDTHLDFHVAVDHLGRLPFARALHEGARLGGCTLPPRRWPK